MPTYQYSARTKSGEPRSGLIETSSKEAAIEALQRQNLIVTDLTERKTSTSILEFKIGGRVKQKDIVLFSRQIATFMEAHVPVVEALKTVMSGVKNKTFKDAILRILDDVSGGLSLSRALARHPNIFTNFYIQLVNSGEESGKLQEVFTYLADYVERSYYLAVKARNSLIYPAFVLTTFVGVIIVMLVTVVPQMVSIFEETGQNIPFYTLAIINLSFILREYGIILLLGLIVSSISLWRWSFTKRGKLFFHQTQLQIPFLGELFRKLYMARFSDNLHMLIVGGIPIIRALTISSDVVGNVVYQNAIKDAIESVKSGSTISAAFEKSEDMPVLVTQMIKIGEASGRLDAILESVARFYQKDVDSAFDNLVSLIEPILILFLGVGVGILVAAILVPLYSLVGNI